MQGTCPALHRSRTLVRRGSGTGYVTPQLDKKTAKNLLFRHNCGIMHRTIKDKATPNTGGITNQCPRNRRITFRARNLEIRIPPIRAHANARNEPNPIPLATNYAKQTQFATNHDPNVRNEPNLPPAPRPKKRNEPNFIPTSPKKCETNPILVYQVSRCPQEIRNEPNFRRDGQNTKD